MEKPPHGPGVALDVRLAARTREVSDSSSPRKPPVSPLPRARFLGASLPRLVVGGREEEGREGARGDRGSVLRLSLLDRR